MIVLKYISGRTWELDRDIKHTLSNGSEVTIPKGFRTDLSSSPRWLWGIFPPYGDFLLASIVHDYLYKYKIGTRAFADIEMLNTSIKLNNSIIDNYLRYFAVRLFGWKIYNK